jgi:hypothetical protein
MFNNVDILLAILGSFLVDNILNEGAVPPVTLGQTP